MPTIEPTRAYFTWSGRGTIGQARSSRELQTGLRREVPLFTKPVAAGLGMAEDPANGMSFGQHRCHLIALAAWISFTRGESTLDARASTLAGLIKAAHLNPSHLHLGPTSRDSHALEAALAITHPFPE
jgi:type III HopA1-like effector protein